MATLKGSDSTVGIAQSIECYNDVVVHIVVDDGSHGIMCLDASLFSFPCPKGTIESDIQSVHSMRDWMRQGCSIIDVGEGARGRKRYRRVKLTTIIKKSEKRKKVGRRLTLTEAQRGRFW